MDAGVIPDGGFTDGGVRTDGGTFLTFPNAAGWNFYGPQNGGPGTVYGVTADQGGNIWVAGGEDGLFLLRPGQSTFQRFTMADGLHPWGYLPDGGDPGGLKYLKVISVSGGPPGTVFVGYEGRSPPNAIGCEDNWDGPNPDPSIYKSGDADRVTLTGSGLSVVHYDIFSGPGVVGAEPRGREKLCSILRIVYDPNTQSVWFGGNHGFAWGDANFKGNPACDGQLGCSGLIEHVHPAINGCLDESCSSTILLTDAYYGIAPDPSGDVWFGGANRSTRFKYMTDGSGGQPNYWQAELDTESSSAVANRIDIWPDAVEEPNEPTPSQRVDDNVSGMAMDADGSVWVSSFSNGVAHLSSSGSVMGYVTSGLITNQASSIHRDPSDGSIWIGESWGGLVRMKGGQFTPYSYSVLGNQLTMGPVIDIQHESSGSGRKMLVAFQGGAGFPGAIGVYSGQ